MIAPADILARIQAEPNVEAHWLMLVAHLCDNGQDDLAAVVRGFWPVLAENLAAGTTLEETLRIAPGDVRRLARVVRNAEERERRG
jgi:hypothetical protein